MLLNVHRGARLHQRILTVLNNDLEKKEGEKNFAEDKFSWNFVQVWMNANAVISENMVVLHQTYKLWFLWFFIILT